MTSLLTSLSHPLSPDVPRGGVRVRLVRRRLLRARRARALSRRRSRFPPSSGVQRRHAPSATLHSPFPSPDLPLPGGAASESSITDVQSSSWPVRVMASSTAAGSTTRSTAAAPAARCRAYGNGWQYNYRLLFDRLPHLIANHLHQQLLLRHRVNRFVEARRRPRPRRRRRAPPPPPRAAAIRRRAPAPPTPPRAPPPTPTPPPAAPASHTPRALERHTGGSDGGLHVGACGHGAAVDADDDVPRDGGGKLRGVRARAEGGGHPSGARRGRRPSRAAATRGPAASIGGAPTREGPPPPGSVSTPPRAPLPAACRCT